MINSAPCVKREKRSQNTPTALTIAGSDSGGGAGIQADLKTFAALGVHGTTALTCVTAQHPREVLDIQACRSSLVRHQLEAVFDQLRPSAVKTGMLFSEATVHVVADFLENCQVPLIVDPVMLATSGAELLHPGALKVLCRRLLPKATLITPNLDEAQALLKRQLRSVEDMRRAAKDLFASFGAAVLVKGGHLRGLREAVDIYYDGTEELLLSAPFFPGVKTHGTGCTYSAAITAYLARGLSLPVSVAKAKEFIAQAIEQHLRVRTHPVLNSFWASSHSKPRRNLT
jgi:hydroxymethylpyrimidine/phosphomethylpyrimidine kinase